MLFHLPIKGNFTTTTTATMDAFYTPLNAKGTCFRIVIVSPTAPIKTPKHIKTKNNKN